MAYNKYNAQTIDKLKSVYDQYKKRIYTKVAELEDAQCYKTMDRLSSPPTEGYTPLKKGDTWGGEWADMWVKGKITVPEEARGKKIFLTDNTHSREVLIFINGSPRDLFNTYDPYTGLVHEAAFITDNAQPGDVYEIDLNCYAGHYISGCSPYDYPNVPRWDDSVFTRTYNGVDLVTMDEEVLNFCYNLKNTIQLAQKRAGTYACAKAEHTLLEVFNIITAAPFDVEKDVWYKNLVEANKLLKPLFEKENTEENMGRVGMIGHSHMDTAWLWPVSETVRKCARTYAKALSLMDVFPEYRFIQSSSLHSNWMREYYPDIFERMKQRVAEGRYEPNGGVWVECDCNITSGEFMVRQFLHGQLFTRKYFNYTSDTFWLPDTFGYNAAIPQIMLGCNVKYFCTLKLGWNDFNKHPYDTFIWEGLDKSRVFTHFMTGPIIPDVEGITGAADEVFDKSIAGEKLMAFGFGDGGGGPTWGMVEDARRSTHTPGIPHAYMTTVSEFMQNIEKKAVNAPVYAGELYLELHRGTLTQMHNVKRNNRKAEFAIHDMEYFNVLSGAPVHEKYDEYVKTLLKNQFHDILPGTSITPVNVKSIEETTQLINDVKAATNEFASSMTNDDEGAITVFNTLSFNRYDDTFTLPVCDKYKGVEGLNSQVYKTISGEEKLVVKSDYIPALGASSYKLSAEADKTPSPFKYDGNHLETPYASVVFDENGYIASLFDKDSRREVRREGGAALGTYFFGEDVPSYWDNWDINYDLLAKMKPVLELVDREVVSDGSVQFVIRSKYKLGNYSSITQDAVFYAHTPRIDFNVVVDWKDKHSFLKVGFDVDVFARQARHEIQFGHIDRPTTQNNSWEIAKFEVANHKWTDISEAKFGVSLLNDCKYGISVNDSNMMLSLHKGGTNPDNSGDEGVHEMTFSLLPHDSGFSITNTVQPAYELNVPCVVAKGALTSEITPLVEILNANNIIVEAIKPAELIEDAFVVRLYEAEGGRENDVKIDLSPVVKKAYTSNMLEDISEELDIQDSRIQLSFRPFEIKTLVFKTK
ncbi:MAG: alpha-mannosidase [Clostridiales bacterium]|nr:alpha-mannosidase [Clostridiales bacterium]